jgi:hypothetical protein
MPSLKLLNYISYAPNGTHFKFSLHKVTNHEKVKGNRCFGLIHINKNDLFKKLIDLAEDGKGRRMLNVLNKKDNALTSAALEEILKVYCNIGLPKEIDRLKVKRGILTDDQYRTLAEDVKNNCSSQKFKKFALSLIRLLSRDIKANPVDNRNKRV